jgi:hypothetical protein
MALAVGAAADDRDPLAGLPHDVAVAALVLPEENIVGGGGFSPGVDGVEAAIRASLLIGADGFLRRRIALMAHDGSCSLLFL